MPYIKKKDREKFKVPIAELIELIQEKGELNYVTCEIVSGLILKYSIGYERISEWIDAVDGAENELRRRILDPYEELKIIENGDVELLVKLLNKIEAKGNRKE